MAAKKTTGTKRAPRKTSAKFYRNLLSVPVSWRFVDTDRKISLTARGQRGDLAAVKKGELGEPEYALNKDSLFEIVSAEEAKLIIQKQETNMQQRAHPALQNIKNQLGEPYAEGAVTVERELNDQGVAVASLDGSGQLEFKNEGVKHGADGTVTGGISIKRSTGFPGAEGNPLIEDVPDSVAPEDQAQWVKEHREELLKEAELDAEAHRKAITERPDEDYLAELRNKTS